MNLLLGILFRYRIGLFFVRWNPFIFAIFSMGYLLEEIRDGMSTFFYCFYMIIEHLHSSIDT